MEAPRGLRHHHFNRDRPRIREEEKNSGGVLERYAHSSSGRCFVQGTKGALGPA